MDDSEERTLLEETEIVFTAGTDVRALESKSFLKVERVELEGTVDRVKGREEELRSPSLIADLQRLGAEGMEEEEVVPMYT